MTREFSRTVSMSMVANGVEIDISHFGGDFLITPYPFSVPPCAARVNIALDGIPDRFTIYLPEGIDPNRDEQPVMMRDAV